MWQPTRKEARTMLTLLFLAVAVYVLHRYVTRGRLTLAIARLVAHRYAPEKVDARAARRDRAYALQHRR